MKKIIYVFVIAAFIGGPVSAQAAEKHLFYANGCCVQGPSDSKAHAYEKIVSELRDAGLKVNFEMRYDDSTENVRASATRVAEQVKNLLATGTPPGDITVSGYSLGSVISLFAAIEIANPEVNYVLLAGCPGSGARHFDIDYEKVQGRILSITDVYDDRFGSCAGRLPGAAVFKEVSVNSGEGHKLFRLTSEENLNLWKEPLLAWTRGEN